MRKPAHSGELEIASGMRVQSTNGGGVDCSRILMSSKSENSKKEQSPTKKPSELLSWQGGGGVGDTPSFKSAVSVQEFLNSCLCHVGAYIWKQSAIATTIIEEGLLAFPGEVIK